MTTESIKLSTVLPAAPQRVYDAWLSSKEHSAFTGNTATVQARAGGRHTAHGGYIHGWNLTLEPGKRIVQSWRSTEFPAESPDSILEVRLAKSGKETRITLVHKDIPAGQGKKYEEGWNSFYFAPMQAYFEKRQKNAGKAKKKK